MHVGIAAGENLAHKVTGIVYIFPICVCFRVTESSVFQLGTFVFILILYPGCL